MTSPADPAILAGPARIRHATLFNALRRALGGGPEGEGLEAIGGVPVGPVQPLPALVQHGGAAR